MLKFFIENYAGWLLGVGGSCVYIVIVWFNTFLLIRFGKGVLRIHKTDDITNKTIVAMPTKMQVYASLTASYFIYTLITVSVFFYYKLIILPTMFIGLVMALLTKKDDIFGIFILERTFNKSGLSVFPRVNWKNKQCFIARLEGVLLPLGINLLLLLGSLIGLNLI